MVKMEKKERTGAASVNFKASLRRGGENGPKGEKAEERKLGKETSIIGSTRALNAISFRNGKRVSAGRWGRRVAVGSTKSEALEKIEMEVLTDVVGGE